MSKNFKLCLSVLFLITFSFGLNGFVISAQAGWSPKKPVEFVIMAGKGGGADRLARFIQGLVEKHKLSTRPFVPINKGGGSGAEALQYLKGKSIITILTSKMKFSNP